jgi:hypothetical protein
VTLFNHGDLEGTGLNPAVLSRLTFNLQVAGDLFSPPPAIMNMTTIPEFLIEVVLKTALSCGLTFALNRALNTKPASNGKPSHRSVKPKKVRKGRN